MKNVNYVCVIIISLPEWFSSFIFLSHHTYNFDFVHFDDAIYE